MKWIKLSLKIEASGEGQEHTHVVRGAKARVKHDQDSTKEVSEEDATLRSEDICSIEEKKRDAAHIKLTHDSLSRREAVGDHARSDCENELPLARRRLPSREALSNKQPTRPHSGAESVCKPDATKVPPVPSTLLKNGGDEWSVLRRARVWRAREWKKEGAHGDGSRVHVAVGPRETCLALTGKSV